jgi:hypothetical protein
MYGSTTAMVNWVIGLLDPPESERSLNIVAAAIAPEIRSLMQVRRRMGRERS